MENVVKLSAKAPAQIVELRMGRKAGILRGTVVDGASGDPLSPFVEFHWVSKAKNALSCHCVKRGQFDLLVPSDVPVSMVVSMDGYENWTYTLGRGEHRNAVLLQPGEELELEVRMWRKR